MTLFQSWVVLVLVALLFFFLGFTAQPYIQSQDRFLVEMMSCQLETEEDCGFVAMPASSFNQVQFLYAQHVK